MRKVAPSSAALAPDFIPQSPRPTAARIIVKDQIEVMLAAIGTSRPHVVAAVHRS
jgi:hypothetical protein